MSLSGYSSAVLHTLIKVSLHNVCIGGVRVSGVCVASRMSLSVYSSAVLHTLIKVSFLAECIRGLGCGSLS